jgi:hypothetical protein
MRLLEWASSRAPNTATPQMPFSPSMQIRRTNWKKRANASWPRIALAFGIETAILTYLLVEFGEENGGELQIPDDVNFFDLVDAANEIDVLSAPLDTLAHVGDGQKPKHVAKDVVDRIRKFRNLIHPAAALRQGYDPRTFTKEDLAAFKEMYGSVTHSLLYYI